MSVKKIDDAIVSAEDILVSLTIAGQPLDRHLLDYRAVLSNAREFLENHHLINNKVYSKVLSRLNQFDQRKN